jgi:hypothetical protein
MDERTGCVQMFVQTGPPFRAVNKSDLWAEKVDRNDLLAKALDGKTHLPSGMAGISKGIRPGQHHTKHDSQRPDVRRLAGVALPAARARVACQYLCMAPK